MYSNKTTKTSCAFPNETESVEFLDSILTASPAVRVFSEVRGEYTHTRPGTERKTPRIDKICIPNKSLVEAGWNQGPFGIECKCSEKKIGPVISQALDYSRAAFDLGDNFWIVPQWIFLWPLDNPKHEIASIMAQNRIGWVRIANGGEGLHFGCSSQVCIRIDAAGMIGASSPVCGRKVGSR